MSRCSKKIYVLFSVLLTFVFSLKVFSFASKQELHQFLSDNNAFKYKETEDYGIPLYQLEVLPQEKYHPKGATYYKTNSDACCGYHSLKNVLLIKDFVEKSHERKSVLEKLQDQRVFDSYFDEWKKHVPDYMDVEEMAGTHVPKFITEEEFDVIAVFSMLRRDYFTSLFGALYGPKKLEIMSYEMAEKICRNISAMQSKEDAFFGIVFQANRRHWIALSLIKINKNKYVFCFDSFYNNKQIDHPVVKFFTQAFAKDGKAPIIKEYLDKAKKGNKTLIPIVIDYLREASAYDITKDGDRKKLVNFMSETEHSVLDLVFKPFREGGNQDLQDVIKEKLEEGTPKKFYEQLYELTSGLMEKFNDESWKTERDKLLIKKMIDVKKIKDIEDRVSSAIKDLKSPVTRGNKEFAENAIKGAIGKINEFLSIITPPNENLPSLFTEKANLFEDIRQNLVGARNLLQEVLNHLEGSPKRDSYDFDHQKTILERDVKNDVLRHEKEREDQYLARLNTEIKPGFALRVLEKRTLGDLKRVTAELKRIYKIGDTPPSSPTGTKVEPKTQKEKNVQSVLDEMNAFEQQAKNQVGKQKLDSLGRVLEKYLEAKALAQSNQIQLYEHLYKDEKKLEAKIKQFLAVKNVNEKIKKLALLKINCDHIGDMLFGHTYKKIDLKTGNLYFPEGVGYYPYHLIYALIGAILSGKTQFDLEEDLGLQQMLYIPEKEGLDNTVAGVNKELKEIGFTKKLEISNLQDKGEEQIPRYSFDLKIVPVGATGTTDGTSATQPVGNFDDLIEDLDKLLGAQSANKAGFSKHSDWMKAIEDKTKKLSAFKGVVGEKKIKKTFLELSSKHVRGNVLSGKKIDFKTGEIVKVTSVNDDARRVAYIAVGKALKNEDLKFKDIDYYVSGMKDVIINAEKFANEVLAESGLSLRIKFDNLTDYPFTFDFKVTGKTEESPVALAVGGLEESLQKLGTSLSGLNTTLKDISGKIK